MLYQKQAHNCLVKSLLQFGLFQERHGRRHSNSLQLWANVAVCALYSSCFRVA